jgi:hypothetical protein
LADTPQAFAAACMQVINGLDIGPAARQRVLATYDWDARISHIEYLLDD